jgi:hypothetical protein
VQGGVLDRVIAGRESREREQRPPAVLVLVRIEAPLIGRAADRVRVGAGETDVGAACIAKAD